MSDTINDALKKLEKDMKKDFKEIEKLRKKMFSREMTGWKSINKTLKRIAKGK